MTKICDYLVDLGHLGEGDLPETRLILLSYPVLYVRRHALVQTHSHKKALAYILSSPIRPASKVRQRPLS